MAFSVTPNLTSYGASKPPSWNAKINWANPLTRGLRFAALFSGEAVRGLDFVNGYAGTVSRSSISYQAIPELGAAGGTKVTSATGATIQFAQTTSDTPYLGDITLFVRGAFLKQSNITNWMNKASSLATTAVPFAWNDGANNGGMNLYRAGASARDIFGTTVANFYLSSLTTPGSYGVTCSGTNGGACIFYAYFNGTFNTSTAAATVANAPYTGSSLAIAMGCDTNTFNFSTDGTYLAAYAWSRILTTAEMLSICSLPYQFFMPVVAAEMFATPIQPPAVLAPHMIAAHFQRKVNVIGY
jgi:hypothetical protein